MTATPAIPAALSVAINIVENVINAIVFAIVGVGIALCYYDLRVRKEGFGGEAAVPVLELPSVPPAPTNNWPIEDLPIS